jgi:hypothetical protein
MDERDEQFEDMDRFACAGMIIAAVLYFTLAIAFLLLITSPWW